MIANYVYYTDILEIIGKWKIISLRNLYNLTFKGCAYESFKRKIRKLEQMQLIKHKRYSHNKKYLYLTELGFKYTQGVNKLEPSQDIFLHDLLLSEILVETLKFSKVTDVTCYPQFESRIEPDGMIYALSGDEELKIALEVELTQKSKTRVVSKLEEYRDSALYDFVLFVTNSERISKTYSRYINELDSSIIQKSVLILNPDMQPTDINLEKSICIYKGKRVKFTSILGEKAMSQSESSTVVVNSRPEKLTEQKPTFTNVLN